MMKLLYIYILTVSSHENKVRETPFYFLPLALKLSVKHIFTLGLVKKLLKL